MSYSQVIKNAIKHNAAHLLVWLKHYMGEKSLFFLLCGVVGALAGFGAFILKTLIGSLTHLLTGGASASEPDWWLLLLPIVGVMLTVVFSRFVVKLPMEHGCERLNRDMEQHIYRLNSRLTFSPLLAATLTLGFGGSAGSEGPIAYTGAAIGSNLGRAFSLSPAMMRLLLGIGAGAGIAGIFKAPIGGMLFSLEVLGMSLTTFSVLGLLIACLTSGAVASACSGYTLDVAYHQATPFGPGMFLPIILLGVFCGLYSLWYTFCMNRMQRLIERVNRRWIVNLASGAFIAVLLFVFPNLYGEGYGVVDDLINGDFSRLLDHSLWYGGDMTVVLLVVAGTLIVKGLAVQATNSGGGVAGDFAPTLFAGALCGFLFAQFANTVCGAHLSVADFAFFGMAAVMAGTIQAPLMALFLTAEMTGDYAMLLPLMIAAAISYGMVKFCTVRLRMIFDPVWHHHLHHP